MVKKGPTIFLALLGILLIFILGLRYGQKVERTNTIVNYVLSLPPTKEPTPHTYGYKTFSLRDCTLSFLVPEGLTVQSSTGSAIFSTDGKKIIEMSCLKDNSISDLSDHTKSTTASAVFRNRKLDAKITSDGYLIFSLTNPVNGKNIWISIDKNLYPLFEKTIEFNQ